MSLHPSNGHIASDLQRRYPQISSTDLRHCNISKATLQFKPDAKPIKNTRALQQPKRPQSIGRSSGAFQNIRSPAATTATAGSAARRVSRMSQAYDQPRRGRRTRRRPRRLNVAPQRGTYDGANHYSPTPFLLPQKGEVLHLW